MRNFGKIFVDSLGELKSTGGKKTPNVGCLAVTGLFIALSMIIEMFTIDLGFAKLNFAFLAIAAIGMLYGPSVGFLAGLACDIVGYIAHPDGGFLPAYVLVAGLQGMIYGLCIYHRYGKTDTKTMAVRMIAARLADVLIINLLINTALNMHYGFIPKESFLTAVTARTVKNFVELFIDIPLLLIILPICLNVYKRTGLAGRSKADTSVKER